MKWQHDCEKCEFKGTLGEMDIYISCQGSLLVRFSDEGSDYESYPATALKVLENDNPDHYAVKLSKQLGLI